MKIWWIPLCMCILLMACSADSEQTIVATEVLIEAQASAVPPTANPTATVIPRLSPEDLANEVPPEILALENEITRDTAWRVLQDAAATESVSPELIRLVHIESARWPGNSLHCDEVQTDSSVLSVVGSTPGYRVILTTGSTVYEYRTDSQDEFLFCGRLSLAEVEGDVLILIDPVAAEMVTLAQRRLTQQLDLPTRRIRLLEINPIIWQDTSLGCPAEGQTYTEMEISGYRIVMAAGVNQYVFHTDFDRLVSCASGDEVLPQSS